MSVKPSASSSYRVIICGMVQIAGSIGSLTVVVSRPGSTARAPTGRSRPAPPAKAAPQRKRRLVCMIVIDRSASLTFTPSIHVLRLGPAWSSEHPIFAEASIFVAQIPLGVPKVDSAANSQILDWVRVATRRFTTSGTSVSWGSLASSARASSRMLQKAGGTTASGRLRLIRIWSVIGSSGWKAAIGFAAID